MSEQSLSESIEFIKNEIIYNDYDNFIKNNEILNKEILNKEVSNKEVSNKEVSNKDIFNKDIFNKEIFNKDIFNKGIFNKGIFNKDISNKEHKYGSDELFESWADNNIFFPIANNIVDPLHQLSLTPNNVTVLSNIFTFLSIYFIHQNEELYAALAYFSGYLLDCVDGKMARKYNFSSKYGMALDLVSNNISNFILIIYLISKFGVTNNFILVIISMTYMLGMSYALNEAIASKKATGSDNFLLRRTNELKNEKDYIYTLFLHITKGSFNLYKSFFKEYNEEIIFKWLPILKHFGPGNYCLLVSIILLYIE